MKRIALSLHDQTIELHDAAGLDDDLEILFGAAKAKALESLDSEPHLAELHLAESHFAKPHSANSRHDNSRHVVTIAREPNGGFALEPADGPAETGLARDDLLTLLQILWGGR